MWRSEWEGRERVMLVRECRSEDISEERSLWD